MMRQRKASATGSCGFFAVLTRMKVRPPLAIEKAMAMRETAAGTVAAVVTGPAAEAAVVAAEVVGAGETMAAVMTVEVMVATTVVAAMMGAVTMVEVKVAKAAKAVEMVAVKAAMMIDGGLVA
jgi:hypothetical protein